MKRFLSILPALTLALTLVTPALATEPQAGDTYIRILGSSGARTVGVRTTYGVYRQTADGAVYRDDRYEFVYTGDGEHWTAAGAVESGLGGGWYDGTQFLACPFQSAQPTWRSADGAHWTALTPEEQAVLPALRRGRAELNGLQFLLRGGRELWVTDGQGRAVELTADFTSFLASYDMADVQAYPARPTPIRRRSWSSAWPLPSRGPSSPSCCGWRAMGSSCWGRPGSAPTAWRICTRPTASPGKRRRGCRRASCCPTTARALWWSAGNRRGCTPRRTA